MKPTVLESNKQLSPLSTQWILEFRRAMGGAVGASLFFVFLSELSRAPDGISLLLLILIFASALVSQAVLHRRRKERARMRSSMLTWLIVADTVGLTIVFHLSGGSHNPFTILYLAQITLSMVAVGVRQSIPVWVLANLGFGSLFLLPHEGMILEHHTGFTNHLTGMLVAFMLTSVLIAYFLQKASRELEQSRLERVRAEKKQEEQLRLASLTSLAAETAHELSTPLSTIALAAGDLIEETGSRTDLNRSICSNAAIISEQIGRAKRLLDRMVIYGGSMQGELPSIVSLQTFADSLASDFRDRWNELSLTVAVQSQIDPVRIPRHSVYQQICSVVKNSREAEATKVQLSLQYSKSFLTVEVQDNGTGFVERRTSSRILN